MSKNASIKIFLAGQRSKNRFGLIDNINLSKVEEDNEEIIFVDSLRVYFTFTISIYYELLCILVGHNMIII